jgi:hypothetical protein
MKVRATKHKIPLSSQRVIDFQAREAG